MDINQLLMLSFLLLFYVLNHNRKSHIYENFDGEINKTTCIERIINYGCLDEEKRNKINEDCSMFEINIATGPVNISCDDKHLFDTLMCNKMLTEGACDCVYGRKQVAAICSVNPVNIECPAELISKDLAIVEKIKELQEVTKQCSTQPVTEDKTISYVFSFMKYGLIAFVIIVISGILIKTLKK
tara:strand:- start:185 stop:739 length:555 start_codon:yes stop_codon:yes gene_type:complete